MTDLRQSPLSVAFRHIRPNWQHYIGFADLAARNGDSAMERFVACYNSLNKDPRYCKGLWPEQICEMANITPGELIGAVCRYIWESKSAETSMITAIAVPEIMIRTAALAKKAAHFKDRELILRTAGLLPDKKGASISIVNAPTAQAAEVKLPHLSSGSARLRSYDEEVIDMGRILDAPFVVKGHVPSDDHSKNA